MISFEITINYTILVFVTLNMIMWLPVAQKEKVNVKAANHRGSI